MMCRPRDSKDGPETAQILNSWKFPGCKYSHAKYLLIPIVTDSRPWLSHLLKSLDCSHHRFSSCQVPASASHPTLPASSASMTVILHNDLTLFSSAKRGDNSTCPWGKEKLEWSSKRAQRPRAVPREAAPARRQVSVKSHLCHLAQLKVVASPLSSSGPPRAHVLLQTFPPAKLIRLLTSRLSPSPSPALIVLKRIMSVQKRWLDLCSVGPVGLKLSMNPATLLYFTFMTFHGPISQLEQRGLKWLNISCAGKVGK